MNNRGIDFISIKTALLRQHLQGVRCLICSAVFAVTHHPTAGLEATRKRGRLGGRLAIDEKTKRHIVTLFQEGESVNNIVKEFQIDCSTVYKILNILSKV